MSNPNFLEKIKTSIKQNTKTFSADLRIIVRLNNMESPKILYTKVANKIAYANSADLDQTLGAV